jgi:hypothetical protein
VGLEARMKKKLLLMILLSVLTFSCAKGAKFEPEDHFEEVNVEQQIAKKFTLRVDKLSVILEKVHKMKEPVPIILFRKDNNSPEFVPETLDLENLPEGASIIGYLVEDNNKIVAKLQQGKMMTEIAELLVERVRIEVETYNALIEYTKLMQLTAKRYRSLWIAAEQRVNNLEADAQNKRLEYKATIFGTIASAIAVIVLLL